jgi:hypothetical protein
MAAVAVAGAMVARPVLAVQVAAVLEVPPELVQRVQPTWAVVAVGPKIVPPVAQAVPAS